ncbi:MAG: CDP-diacylglycerol--serine O-phosphatidyltransferase [Flavobacteriales bacterium]|jgi:CDP-diacylglycerol---serine O-phosphatidyltransferase|nr:CDP-diacylglycerol--serine O-phosphatidyltransferase [Flavobacteriales bacterium]
MIKAIPNTLTLCNLVCGCFGIVFAFNQQLEWAGYLIGIAAIFDFLDGFVARLLNAKSLIGGQLDSLADIVTFGVLPGVIIFQLLSISFGEYFVEFSQRPTTHIAIQCIGFLIVTFSALRLAKFNIDESQSDSFVGMPTPAIAIFIGSLPVVLFSMEFNFYNPLSPEMLDTVGKMKYWSDLDFAVVSALQSTAFLFGMAVVCSAMLVVPLRMLALKFSGFGWSENKNIFVFLILVMIIAVYTAIPYVFYYKGMPVLDFLAIPLVILIYLLYSGVTNIIKAK